MYSHELNLLALLTCCCCLDLAPPYRCLQQLSAAKIFTLRSQGHEAMVKWTLFSQSRVQTTNNDQKRWTLVLSFTSTFSHPQGTSENGAKTERTWYLMWKTADRFLLDRNQRNIVHLFRSSTEIRRSIFFTEPFLFLN